MQKALRTLSSFFPSPPPSPVKGERAKSPESVLTEYRTLNPDKYFFNRSGFTMIELIISIVILGILGVYTFSFLGDTMGAYVRVKEHKTLYDEGRIAMDRMARDIRNASRASINIYSNPIRISFTRPDNWLITTTYRLSSGTLDRRDGIAFIGTYYDLAGNVQNFNPTYTANVVTLNLVLTQAGRGTVQFRTSIYPRNP